MYGWIVFKVNPFEPRVADYQRFRELFPDAAIVYGDSTSLIYYYAHTHNAKWTYQDRFLVGGKRIAVYDVDDGARHPVRILRNKGVPFFDLAQPETYTLLADTLRHEKIPSAVLYYDSLSWEPASTKILENKFRELAPLAGLEFGRYAMGSTYAFIEFKLK